MKELVGTASTAAASPTHAELRDSLAVNETRAAELLPVLTPAPLPPGGLAVVGGAAGAAAAAAPVRASPQLAAEPRPVALSTRAQLPSAPGGARHPDTFGCLFTHRSVMTRSMTCGCLRRCRFATQRVECTCRPAGKVPVFCCL